jgi:hypothetical protein
MSKTLVTSFTEKNYNDYAKNMIDTFREFWPKSVKLVIFYEGDNLPEDEENIQWRYADEIEGFTEWMDDVSKFPFMCGKTPHGYDIQHDARHARKALTEMYGCKVFGGKVFWIDGDFITHQKVPEGWLDEILPDDKFSCYCGREGWMYSETGFIGFNSDHELYEPFMQAYMEVFRSGLIFTLKGWHDCYGFDAVRHVFNQPHHFSDLSAHLPQGTMHPICNSVLGTYLDHKKGPRKSSRSKQSDLVIERTEPYWTCDEAKG